MNAVFIQQKLMKAAKMDAIIDVLVSNERLLKAITGLQATGRLLAAAPIVRQYRNHRWT